MRSVCLVSVISLALFGCVSTQGEEAGHEVSPAGSTNEPCPAAPPLVSPVSEGSAQADDKTAPAAAAPAEAAGEAVILAPDEATPPEEASPAETQTSREDDKPDVRSHIDVDAVPPEIQDKRDYFVTSPALNVRSAPSTQSAVTRQLNLGEKVTSYGREGIWVQIGQEEYVSIIYLSDRPVPTDQDNSKK